MEKNIDALFPEKNFYPSTWMLGQKTTSEYSCKLFEKLKLFIYRYGIYLVQSEDSLIYSL